jgi:hypothetical protein
MIANPTKAEFLAAIEQGEPYLACGVADGERCRHPSNDRESCCPFYDQDGE